MMTTRKMAKEARMKQEELQDKMRCIQHYKCLESTYEADFESVCNVETDLYAQMKPLQNEISSLYKDIRSAYKAHAQRCKNMVPYDEDTYEASHQMLCDIENDCYKRITHLKEEIKTMEHEIIRSNIEFERKYKPYRTSVF